MNSADRVECEVYRSRRRDEMYLYVALPIDRNSLPEALVTEFLCTNPVLKLWLDSRRKLARVSAEAVIEALRERGYYLQMPPRGDATVSSVDLNNEKLPRSR